MQKKPIIIISVLCVISLVLGYWSGQEEQEVASGSDVKSSEKKEPEFLKEGLVAYYPFDDSSVIGAGNGISEWNIANRKEGLIIRSLDIDGYNQISISIWVKYNLAGSEKVWILALRRGCIQWVLDKNGYSNAKNYFGIYAGTHWENLQNEGSLDENKWYMLTVVYDGATIKQLKNGKVICERSCNLPILVHPDSRSVFKDGLTIGSTHPRYPISDDAECFIDDVRIYNRALSAEEVKALYEFEKANRT